MKLTIHRGTNEIGGSCVELRTDSTRLLIDFGMPLFTATGKEFDDSVFKNNSIDKLVKLAALPDIEGVYNGKSSIDGILLSHSHMDHYGLLNYINEDIHVYLGEATGKLIEINNIFLNRAITVHNPKYFTKNIPFTIGGIKITPYWMDHSAFDAYAFLIESGDKRIFYSGDFRSHGRKEGAYRWFLMNAPKDIDYLILEGTSIGRKPSITELGVENKLTEIFKVSDNGCYVWTSSQNIDRLVSVFKACVEAKKTLVLDIYTANVLNILSQYGKLPNPLKGFTNMLVLYNHTTTIKLYKSDRTDLVFPFIDYKIKSIDLQSSPSKYVVMSRPSLLPEIKKIGWKDGVLVYSMWSGYKTKTYSAKFLEYFSTVGFETKELHSSGHADEATLIEFANALKPKNIIPIHTFQKNQYQSLFSQNVLVVDDNQEIEL